MVVITLQLHIHLQQLKRLLNLALPWIFLNISIDNNMDLSTLFNLNWTTYSVASEGFDSTLSIIISRRNKSLFETISPQNRSLIGFSNLFSTWFLLALHQCPFLLHFRQLDSFARQSFSKWAGPKHFVSLWSFLALTSYPRDRSSTSLLQESSCLKASESHTWHYVVLFDLLWLFYWYLLKPIRQSSTH